MTPTSEHPSEQSSAIGRECEWLLANGLGGFAMGTLRAVNARRYHGLLIAALHPPVGRTVVLHSTAEHVSVEGELRPIARQLFGRESEPHPDDAPGWTDFQHIDEHTVAWRCALDAYTVEKRVHLPRNANAVAVLYRLRGALPTALHVRCMTPLRVFHGLTHDGDPPAPPEIELPSEAAMLLRRGELRIRLFARSSAGAVRSRIDPQWWYDCSYPFDRDRGQPYREDVWSPGGFEFDLTEVTQAHGDDPLELRIDVEVAAPMLPTIESRHEASRLRRASGSSVRDRLEPAADQFIARRLSADRQHWSHSIIAGYPWFADWGRDAMICVPGLLLTRGRIDEAVSVLRTFAGSMRNGLIPNCFLDDGGALYNSVDAGLWFIHAVAQVHDDVDRATQDALLRHCRTILDAYQVGTDFDICMDGDGLIAAGNPETQITWMDAARDGVVFTPRHGKAVEINALWYNALRSVAALTPDTSEAQQIDDLGDRVQQSFVERFWWPQRECLHDVLSPNDGGGFVADATLRPNQIFAVSLPHSPLSRAMQRSVLRTVEQRLLTPYGLRTLDPDDPDYQPRFEGNLFQRDAAYHQGTVWPWLLGPFCEALLRVNDFASTSTARVQQIIDPMLSELDTGCVGQLPEVYDADPPHRADGCVAQAWTVAELMRVLSMIDKTT